MFVEQSTSKAKPSLVILSLLIVGELGRFMFVRFVFVWLYFLIFVSFLAT